MRMTITIQVRGRIASVRDAPEIVCGNNDYVLQFDWDSEWDAFESATCCIVCFTADGEARSEITVSEGTVALPALHNVSAIEVGLTAGDVRTTTPARISCLPCITDGNAAEAAPVFDVYNAMMEYLATRDAAIYAALEEYRSHIPDPEEFPSAAYRAAIAAPQRVTRITGTLTLQDGTEQEITENDIIANTLAIRTDCMTDDVVLPGGVPSAELTVTLRGQEEPEALYGAELAPVYQLMLPSGAWYDVPLGVFTVAAADSTTEQYAAVTGYDDMQKLSSIPFEALGIAAGQAYSAEELVAICADALGLECEYDGTMLNTSVRCIAADAANRIETARDLLMFAVQMLGAFAYIDRFRVLRIKALSVTDPVATVSAAGRKTLTASRKLYRLYQINAVYAFPDSDDNMVVKTWKTHTMWGNGVTAELPENPLFTVIRSSTEARENYIHSCIVQIARALDPVVFTPITAECFDDPAAELFEWRQFTQGSGTFTAPITSIDWQYHGTQTVRACGADAVQASCRHRRQSRRFPCGSRHRRHPRISSVTFISAASARPDMPAWHSAHMTGSHIIRTASSQGRKMYDNNTESRADEGRGDRRALFRRPCQREQ